MSYQVIALKWRPQNFQNMIGQKHISQTLQNALKSGRLPQAILFTGPRGTGKTSTARILAKSLRCSHLKDFVPCGTCSDCVDISAGRSLDVIEIDGASNNGVDSIRELRDSVSFRPSSGDKKVYIIDEVHMLSISAFNALLKTLEEPPDHVVFILATTEVHKIPKTILSRCHRFDFRKISIQDMAEYLERICTEEGVSFEKEALWSIARQGQGSVRDSLSFLDQVITYSNKNLTYDNVRESLGLTDRRLLTQILESVVGGSTDTVMGALESIFSSGTDINIVAEDVLEEFKNLLIVKTSKAAKNYVDLPEAEIEILTKLAQNISEAHIHLLFDMMLKLTQDLYRTQDQKTVLEVGVLKLCLYRQVVDVDKMFSSPTGQALGAPSVSGVSSPMSTAVASVTEGGTASGKVTYRQEAALKLKVETKRIALASQPQSSAPSGSPHASKKPARPKTTSVSRVFANTEMTEMPRQHEAYAPKGHIGSAVEVAKGVQTIMPQATEEQKKWNGFVEKIQRLNVKVGEVLKNCHYLLSEDSIEISAPEKLTFIQEDIAKAEFQKLVSNYVRTFLGPSYQFKIIADSELIAKQQGQVVPTQPKESSVTVSTLAKETAELKRKQEEAIRRQVEESEVVQNLKKTFKNVEIISVKEYES